MASTMLSNSIFVAAATRERRQYGEDVALLHGRLELVEVTNVLVVEIDVHKAMQLAVSLRDLVEKAGVSRVDAIEHLGHGFALAGHNLLAAGQLLQHGGHAYFNWHTFPLSDGRA